MAMSRRKRSALFSDLSVQFRPTVAPSHRDEELVRSGAAEMLSDAGYIVLQASFGYETASLLTKHQDIKVHITNYAMPGMICAELARHAHPTQCLATRSRHHWLRFNGWKVALDIPRLPKPFGQAELVDAVSKLLEHASVDSDVVDDLTSSDGAETPLSIVPREWRVFFRGARSSYVARGVAAIQMHRVSTVVPRAID